MANSEENKPQFSLLPWDAVEGAARAFTYGAKKYEPFGWRKEQVPVAEHLDGAMRHILAVLRGELNDKESKLPHLDHAAARLLMAHDALYRPPQTPPPAEPPKKGPGRPKGSKSKQVVRLASGKVVHRAPRRMRRKGRQVGEFNFLQAFEGKGAAPAEAAKTLGMTHSAVFQRLKLLQGRGHVFVRTPVKLKTPHGLRYGTLYQYVGSDTPARKEAV